jgi:hypothetical protein
VPFFCKSGFDYLKLTSKNSTPLNPYFEKICAYRQPRSWMLGSREGTRPGTPNNSKFIFEFHVFTGLHGVCIFFGLKPFAADRFLPFAVIGPVLSPP